MPITWTFYLEDGTFGIENYFLDVETRKEALRAAGFQTVAWPGLNSFVGLGKRPARELETTIVDLAGPKALADRVERARSWKRPSPMKSARLRHPGEPG